MAISRRRILQAAADAFAEGGYHQTTLRAIGVRAGRDPALILRHFGDKTGLFEAALHWALTSAAPLPAGEGFGVALAQRLGAIDERRLWRLLLAARFAPAKPPWTLVIQRLGLGVEGSRQGEVSAEASSLIATCLGVSAVEADPHPGLADHLQVLYDLVRGSGGGRPSIPRPVLNGCCGRVVMATAWPVCLGDDA